MIKNHKYPRFFRTVSFILILALALPSLLKSMHALEGHKHELCTSVTNEHLHEAEWDCEFDKFNLSDVHRFESFDFTFDLSPEYALDVILPKYALKSSVHQTTFLRGPPGIV